MYIIVDAFAVWLDPAGPCGRELAQVKSFNPAAVPEEAPKDPQEALEINEARIKMRPPDKMKRPS